MFPERIWPGWSQNAWAGGIGENALLQNEQAKQLMRIPPKARQGPGRINLLQSETRAHDDEDHNGNHQHEWQLIQHPQPLFRYTLAAGIDLAPD